MRPFRFIESWPGRLRRRPVRHGVVSTFLADGPDCTRSSLPGPSRPARHSDTPGLRPRIATRAGVQLNPLHWCTCRRHGANVHRAVGDADTGPLAVLLARDWPAHGRPVCAGAHAMVCRSRNGVRQNGNSRGLGAPVTSLEAAARTSIRSRFRTGVGRPESAVHRARRRVSMSASNGEPLCVRAARAAPKIQDGSQRSPVAPP
jgi:hypothetical protein